MTRTAPPSGRLSALFTWRSAVASDHGPGDFDLDVVREGEAATTTVKGSTQRHVALTLSLHMNERGGSCYPGVPRLAAEAKMGERSVQRALLALAAGGWLHVGKQESPVGTNLYTATIPDSFPVEERGGVPGTPAYPVREGGVPGTPEGVIEDVNVSPTERLRLDVVEVADAWRANAPPLIEHRASFFEDAKTKAAIRRALKTYPAADIAEAIRCHAIVLSSDAFRWTYRWTLIQFLQRGLDRFVPEADPLGGNFRSHGQTKPTGDFSQIDEL